MNERASSIELTFPKLCVRCDEALSVEQRVIGKVHAALSRRRARVSAEDVPEGHTSLFVISGYLPKVNADGFVEEIRSECSRLLATPFRFQEFSVARHAHRGGCPFVLGEGEALHTPEIRNKLLIDLRGKVVRRNVQIEGVGTRFTVSTVLTLECN